MSWWGSRGRRRGSCGYQKFKKQQTQETDKISNCTRDEVQEHFINPTNKLYKISVLLHLILNFNIVRLDILTITLTFSFLASSYSE